MQKEVAIGNIAQVSKQRNLFLLFALLLLVTSVALSIKLMSSNEKVVLVPGLLQEVWVEDSGVSKGYLEETTLMYLPMLLDLNPAIVDHKADIIFKYISQSKPRYMESMQEYFARSKAQYKQFGLSTYFSVKTLEVDTKNLHVIANGVLTSRYGDRGIESTITSYGLSYEWVGGRLRLKEFERIKEEK